MSGAGQSLMGSILSQLQPWLATNAALVDGVAYENREYTPPDPSAGKAWLRVTFVPAETRQASCGDAGMNWMGGIVIINVFFPKGGDAGGANALADSLVSQFKRGTDCPSVSGYSARIQNTWRGQALPDEGWFSIPVRTRWYQQVTNT